MTIQASQAAVMRTYRCSFNFVMLFHIMMSLSIIHNTEQLVSVSHTIQELSIAGKNITMNCSKRKYPLSNKFRENMKFSTLLFKVLLIMVSVTWLLSLLLLSGDIQPNPGPSSASSTSSSIDSSVTSVLSQSHHLSFIHYNVQSILHKLDILTAELSEFDILAFSETWLHPNILGEELEIPSYSKPERKDRVNDPHGGVLIYIKDTIHYKRRLDLEPAGNECIWIEIILRNKHILFGVFYRPPNSTAMYHSTIEDSIHLAIDTGIQDVVITGDFNYNLLSDQTHRKILSLCQQFSLHQCISEPTHYSENSSSLIDIILVSNKNNVIFSGVGDPFLSQNTRYHCPVFGILKFSKPKRKIFTRHVWLFDQGNYDLLRQKTLETDWNNFKSTDINRYTETVTEQLIEIAKQCIPNKLIKVHPTEPQWITNDIKRQIRKRKRLYKRAKGTNDPDLWRKFKKLRNETFDLIRKTKQLHIKNLADKLKSETQCTKNWWSTLKKFINPSTTSTIPPLQVNDNVLTEDEDKANLLNDYFRDQTIINDDNIEVPIINDYNLISRLNRIILTPDEVKIVLKSLPLGKASGPDGVNNRILKELADILSLPFCDLFNQSLALGEVPESWKRSHVTPVPKSGDLSLVSNYRPIALLSNIDKVFERVVFKHLYNHLHENSILTTYQSGFTPGDSTIN
ncbi:MAG: endonuclease/exonuclease/phosphatase family protein, partial [Candidatus Thiodiazotropha sp.]